MTSFTLKIIALITMFCDHFGDAFLGHFSFLNLIGRIAFPIFAFQISEGFIHTKNIKKYFIRLFLFALISQLPFYLFSMKVFGTTTLSLNVFFTLILGLLSIYLYDKITKLFEKSKEKNASKKAYIYSLCAFFIVILLGSLADILHTDYGFWGVLVVFMFYILKNNKIILTIVFGLFCILKYLSPLIETNFNILYIFITLFTFIPIIFIDLYNGKQGYKIRYLLYIFYPVHLLLLYLI